jgi:hypothetical protein
MSSSAASAFGQMLMPAPDDGSARLHHGHAVATSLQCSRRGETRDARTDDQKALRHQRKLSHRPCATNGT